MAIPFRATVTGSSGASRAWMPDISKQPFAVGVGCVPTGTVTYSVQHTFDPIFTDFQIPGVAAIPSSAATWHNHTSLVALSCAIDGNYAFPVLGIRVVTSSQSGSGSVKVTLTQAGA